MNEICKQYISEVKAFFPIMGKSEKKYIEKLKSNVENYCEEAQAVSKEDLYKSYGLPNEVVNEYYSSVGTDYIIKRTGTSRFIKALVAVILALALAVAATLGILKYDFQKVSERQREVIYVETTPDDEQGGGSESE